MTNLSESKDYLTKQEIAEGAVNTGLFYTVCEYVRVKTLKMLIYGTILPKSTRELLKEISAPQFLLFCCNACHKHNRTLRRKRNC